MKAGTKRDAAKSTALVGTYVQGFYVEQYVPGGKVEGKRIRQKLVLRCPNGHRIARNAWDIIQGTGALCDTCKSAQSLSAQKPEVCNCTYFDNVLRRMCGWCERAQQQRGAA